MEYSIFKDAKPKDTVKRIKKILKKHGIETEVKICEQREGFNRPYSVRVFLKEDYKIGTNGKGTSLENAIASGYAEFMERLQNLLVNSTKKFANCFYASSNDSQIRTILNTSSIEILERYLGMFQSKDKILVSEFFEIASQKIKLIPEADLLLQGSNGMCAGNTKEEALVQGICEVCERYSLKEVFSKKISLPEIPLSEYEQFEKIIDLIQWYKDFNYKITIKDASLGIGLPVVCTIFEDLENKVFHVVFGANPSLPIAIERCLTEFAQGFDLANKNFKVDGLDLRLNPYFRNMHFDMIKNELSGMPWVCNFSVPPVLEYNEFFNDIFFAETSRYMYNQTNFIDLNKKYNNKKLLSIMLENLTKLTKEAYIKDVSYLDFPAFLIYVPNITNEVETEAKYLEKYINFFKISIPSNKNLLEKMDLNTIKDFLLVSSKWGKRKMMEFILEEYLLLLCAIIDDNKDNVIAYCNFLIQQEARHIKFKKDRVNIYSLIKDYYLTEKNKKYIEDKYSPTEVKNFFNLIDNLSLKSIAQLIDSHLCLARPSDERLNLYDKIAQPVIKAANKKKNITKKLKKVLAY